MERNRIDGRRRGEWANGTLTHWTEQNGENCRFTSYYKLNIMLGIDIDERSVLLYVGVVMLWDLHAGVVDDMRGGERALWRRRAPAHARAGQDVVRELQEEVQDATTDQHAPNNATVGTTDVCGPVVTLAQQEAPSLLDGMLWQNIHPLDLKEEEGEAATSEGARSVKEDDCLPINLKHSLRASTDALSCSSLRRDGVLRPPDLYWTNVEGLIHFFFKWRIENFSIVKWRGPLHPAQYMSNGRVSSCNDERDDTTPNVLEPQVQIIPQSPPTPPPKTPIPALAPLANLQTLANPLHVIEQARFTHNYFQKLNELSNTPLNLSHLDNEERRSNASPKKQETNHRQDCATATDEERLYYTAKRQHAIWEHEAKMKILTMELKQKEELFSLQKQLFLIELKLKMDFLEKASAK
ncbi:hypothetical protein EVAR_94619_1 [Eumeta japonica]|uniref:Uncharacterized protein n=1 Tax=Eumeta variegata TaxID=151549 RepID=A0A4C1UU09_EUMVA|nr:hypothetical protein EVAR_94619_1 [Eumeta japonica]